MEKMTIQEEEVMIYIWELEICFVKEIVAKFEPPVPPYRTVASIVKNLERKGY
ncbi:BlaI/MecI/CopY family transcriptional regulator, partial [Bacteroides nordii]|uniref:BlaI/MecI/CopY family transcriptional regulator n=1 Tax=Bacteroides nordii TaxID=291645 RepID=UPI00210D051D